jgi:hypothetical protein
MRSILSNLVVLCFTSVVSHAVGLFYLLRFFVGFLLFFALNSSKRPPRKGGQFSSTKSNAGGPKGPPAKQEGPPVPGRSAKNPPPSWGRGEQTNP